MTDLCSRKGLRLGIICPDTAPYTADCGVWRDQRIVTIHFRDNLGDAVLNSWKRDRWGDLSRIRPEEVVTGSDTEVLQRARVFEVDPYGRREARKKN